MLGKKYNLGGVPRMPRAPAVLLLCCITSPAVFAQSSDPDQLSDKERLGWRLYEQSCSICHTKPNLVLGQFGPVLSRESLNGRPEPVREVIANGTPRKPGFKHHFAPRAIDAADVGQIPGVGAGAELRDRQEHNRSQRGEAAGFCAQARGGFLSTIARRRHAGFATG